ncbi:MAG: DUF2018 family protein [Campylobacterota bacterium]|nr:DUF2018 family protein [Campylobacterota bacterium]
MANYEALFEDEDNIFGGSPKSKYHDIANQANNEIVEDEMEKILEKYAYMEMMLSKDKPFDYDIFKDLEMFKLENSIELEQKKKSLYIEFTGDIVCRLDS